MPCSVSALLFSNERQTASYHEENQVSLPLRVVRDGPARLPISPKDPIPATIYLSGDGKIFLWTFGREKKTSTVG